MNRWTCASCGARNETDGDAVFCPACGATFSTRSTSASASPASGVLGGFVSGFSILFCETVAIWTYSKATGCFAIVGPITGCIAVMAGLFLIGGIRSARRGWLGRSRLLLTAGFIVLVPTAACAVQSYSRTRC